MQREDHRTRVERPVGPRLWRSPVILLALCVSVLLASCGEGGGQTEPDTAAPAGNAEVLYDDRGIDPENRKAAELLRESGVLERIATTTNDWFELPRDLPIEVTDHDLPEGVDGPATLPDGTAIFIPPSFVTLTSRLVKDFAREQDRPREFSPEDLTVGAIEFLTVHELGHALTRQLMLPITGKEEDAVDGFAALSTLNDEEEGPLPAVGAVALFAELANRRGSPAAEELADEHALHEQRVYNFLCFVYGSDPERYGDLLTGDDALPKQRAAQCPQEWAQANTSWVRLLEPYLTDQGRAQLAEAGAGTK